MRTYQRKRPLKLFTHSSISTLRICPQKYEIEYELNIRPVVISEPLRIGTAYHAGREVDREPVEVGLARIWDLYKAPPIWCQDADQRHAWLCEAAKVMALYAGFRRHSKATYKILAAELPFSIQIPGLKAVRNAGKVDMIVELEDARRAVLEVKTCGEDIGPSADYWRKLRLDAQITRYLVAAQDLGWEVSTIIYDVTRKPDIRPKNIPSKAIEEILSAATYCGGAVIVPDSGYVGRAVEAHRAIDEAAYFAENQDKDTMPKSKRTVPKIRETPGLYALRIAAAIDEDPDRYFQTIEIPRLARDIDSFNEKMLGDVAEVRWRRQTGVWQKNDHACTAMGTCAYLGGCANLVDWAALEDHQLPAGFHRIPHPHPELGEELP